MNETGRVAAVTPAMAEARAAQGKVAFEATCSGCHSAKPGENGTGPSMFGVLGRKAGSLDGYGYSPAMSGSSVIWSAESLDKHLADTKNFIPGNRMGRFFAGVEDQATRSEIIAYLATLK
jgi:cytochrome c2